MAHLVRKCVSHTLCSHGQQVLHEGDTEGLAMTVHHFRTEPNFQSIRRGVILIPEKSQHKMNFDQG